MSARTDAYEQGAQHRRAGITLSRTLQNFTTPEEVAYAKMGYCTQQAHPTDKVQYPFFLTHGKCKVCLSVHQASARGEMKMRTAEEIEKLKEDYRPVYDQYAAEQVQAGNEPQSFEDAFANHLEALNAEETAAATAAGASEDDQAPAAPTAGKKGKGKGKAKAEAKPKAAAAPKEPKAKAFRPTSEDRKAVNTAAANALKAAKKEGTPRLKLTNGDPYVEFLQGRALKLDAKGAAGPFDLAVFTAADTATRVGTVTITVKNGNMTAKGSKL